MTLDYRHIKMAATKERRLAFVCEHCGEIRQLRKKVSRKMMLKADREFAQQHTNCRCPATGKLDAVQVLVDAGLKDPQPKDVSRRAVIKIAQTDDKRFALVCAHCGEIEVMPHGFIEGNKLVLSTRDFQDKHFQCECPETGELDAQDLLIAEGLRERRWEDRTL